ncbi:hypothetical protein JTB14_030031 [Gonioctena quinquepunctata]|nr:hypothetical protein JTB14_030031 [Gonioctena quinquepunctata]
MKYISEELGIPRTYLQKTAKADRFIAVVHKSWLKSLIKNFKLQDFIEKSDGIWSTEKSDPSWTKIFISSLRKKDCKVLPLPRIRTLKEDPFLFPQLMQYISQTNYKNLWKDSYNKYSSTKHTEDTEVNIVNYDDVLKETIIRMYGCPIINIYDSELTVDISTQHEKCSNIFPTVCAVETLTTFFLIHLPHLKHNLGDCITFSPAILDKCHTKSLFIIYQLLNILKSLHECSLTMGDLDLNDLFLTEDMWIYVIPQIDSNFIYVECSRSEPKNKKNRDCQKQGHMATHNKKCDFCGVQTYDENQVKDESLEELCLMWIKGQISNFTYISALNKFSGRVLGDPNCHYVFPWVTDFTSRCGKNWRDLKKSKYRLNKGDHQLDLTYDNCQSQVPHHVSDVLSSITYYVYMARRTPAFILCENVRTVWVPAEYPSSIQRIQEWTPDECIPEFYSDPSIFRSIHEDLDDLAVPLWASGPEDFIVKHREALESPSVSERIHHWIDLTFGYKLSGSASVKARNVCLNLVDDHESLTKSGLVQLFTAPHPPRAFDFQYWAKSPPKIFVTKSVKQRTRGRSNSSTTQELNSCETIIELSKISNSRSSLHEEPKRSHSNQRNESSNNFNLLKSKEMPGISSNSNSEIIHLPKDYKPDYALEYLERKYFFFSKTFPPNKTKTARLKKNLEEESYDNYVQDVLPNILFPKNFQKQIIRKFQSVSKNQVGKYRKTSSDMLKESIICNYGDIITSRRIQELKVLGCLIVEMFMAKQLRVLGANQTFNNRLKNCLSVIESSDISLPPSVSYVVNSLLGIDKSNSMKFTYPAVSDMGLPPPCAHLLLEPLLHCVIPFSTHFPKLYKLLHNLKEFKYVAMELDILYLFECNGQMCSEFEPLEKAKTLLYQTIAECKVKTSLKHLEILLNDLNINTDGEIISILVPHIKDLIEDAPTSVLAAWYLFEPISRVLGPHKSSQYLLDSLLKLYENDYNEIHLPYIGKVAKIYHHSFLLCLMIRLGLKCFLNNFIVPLVEAVGGYKNCELVDFILHNHSEKTVKKASHLKTIDSEQMDISGSDDSSSSDKQVISEREKKAPDEEIFEFEDDKNEDDQMKFLIEHLQLNVSSDLPYNNLSIEEGLDANLTDSIEDLGEIIPPSERNIESGISLKSPTIPIPLSYHNNVMNISCEIGSRNDEGIKTHSSDSFLSCEPQKVLHKSKHKISEISSDSLIWLSHRLGPLLTARYLSRNLLKMLALCYIGKDNLTTTRSEDFIECSEISVASSHVLGDKAAFHVLGCLTSISGLYGEQIILFQYIPHITEIVLLCKKRLTPNLEGGLISCLALFKHIIPYMSDVMLMDQLQDVLLKNIIHPVVRLLNSTKHIFPSGGCARNILAQIPNGTCLQRFFSIFDSVNNKIFDGESIDENILRNLSSSRKTSDSSESYQPVQRTHFVLKELKSADKCSSPEEIIVNRALAEMQEVFTSELAYTAYLPFIKLLGSSPLEISLNNHDRVRYLCQEYEEYIKLSNPNSVPKFKLSDFTRNQTMKNSSSIGSNVSLIGNRIDVQPELIDNFAVDLLSLVSNRMENNTRHLHGNWLAYWEHEIGRSDINNLLNFKQIKLQTFVGHSQSVKCLYTLDNENSFLSGSRDKTVKLWSLRSQGDGFNSTNCQWTYNAHKKSILSVTFIESLRLVASCDSVVHIWDPFMGANLGNLESTKCSPVNALKSMPAPSTLVFASTTDGTIKILDIRMLQYVQELKININPTSLIRCLAIPSSGLWVAAGQSSGNITVIDSRTGLILSNWRAHESEVLQLVAHGEDTIISTSLDQTTSVWSISDGKFKFHMRGTTEPVHCLSIHKNELISGTTANRIGVHASIASDASFSNNKLSTDTFKGLLTSMDYLPLNKLLLLGADTGNINLLC